MNIRSSVLQLPVTTPAQHSRPTHAINTALPLENTLPGTPTRSEAEALGLGQKPNPAPTPNHEFDVAKGIIYGSVSVSPPTASYTQQERLQRIDAYAGRVVTQIKNIESGEEGESNIRFQKTRQFLEPAGYFSGGLLAAGFDPHEKITVTFNSYVGKWKPEVKTDTEKRTYFAWEIAAGALKHDRPAGGGLLNFQTLEIKPQDRSKINDLEALGAKLQDHWKDEIAKPMSDESGALAKRSGKADAYVVKGILQGLRNDKDTYKTLTPEAREAIDRTLDKNGNVVIPNIYGYPLSGYAFIPYVNYHGNYDTRPNQGVMFDLKNGTVAEIKGDNDFAQWAKNNREALQRSFNARDRQGGNDAHWPSATSVLDNLISGNHATYPGRRNLLSDKQVPVREAFNYTQSRKHPYHLRFGDLKSGIAASYQEVNVNNATWADQTEVFGSSQQMWKQAKELWGRTFGYVPIVGNAGNIVFGVHDSIYGMTANDRVGGTAAAIIASLQLVHEIAPSAAEAGLGEAQIKPNTINREQYGWTYDERTRSHQFVRKVEASNQSDMPHTANTLQNEQGTPSAGEVERTHPTGEIPDNKPSILTSIEGLPTGEALFSTPEKNVILSGELNELNTLDKKLYTFTDFNKKGTQERLNILVHGSVDPETGIAKVSYNEKLHTPAELLQTLHDADIHPETFDNVRLLSCDSASGGDASFAAQFQKLIGRPVKGYSGTLTTNLAPENINAAILKVEAVYLEALKNNHSTPLTAADKALVRSEAEQYVSRELAKTVKLKPSKKNPYWHPVKWWAFAYKPVTFPAP
ncbi:MULTISPECIES: hypothetical protein [Pseudomonas]|uniref:hypothetical protein n=1 Tax=Pseudomonas TaxID=286 RepID=UPI001AE76632|nr:MULTISPECIES: hypothetical protein [unclassified Pseudomonas]